jgi:glutaredoxin
MLIFYTRASCKLCQQAKTVLTEAGIAFESREVDSQPDWQRQWGWEVPVLIASDGQILAKGRLDEAQLASILLRLP